MELSETLEAIFKTEELANGLNRLFNLPANDPMYVRRALFVACASKLAAQAKALKLLAESDLPEEAVGMARVMVEVVINAIYLQFADESEVTAFMCFDSLKISYYLAKKNALDGDSTAAQKHEQEALRIGAEIGKSGTEFSWCKKSIAKRAMAVDEQTTLKIFAVIQENSSLLGNLPLHGSFISMMHLMPSAYKEWPHRAEFCTQGAHLALNAVRGFAHFADRFFPSESL